MSVNFKTEIRKNDIKLCLYVFCILLPLLLSPLAVSSHKEVRCGYVVLLVAIYWLLEPVSIAATALMPVVLLPLLGVVSSQEVCSNYMKEIIMMIIGGMMVAIAVEDSGLHERVALKALSLVGTDIKRLLLGFMLTTMLLSMWISNTATTAMMIPIVEAIMEEITINKDEEDDYEDKNTEINGKGRRHSLTESKQIKVREAVSIEKPRDIRASKSLSAVKSAFLLSVCYSANIGGTGFLTGAGSNLILKGLMDELYPESGTITFVSWMMYNVPGMILCTLTGWFCLWMIYIRCSNKDHDLQSKERIKKIISKRYADLGSISAHELQVIILFMGLVFLWTFREPKFISGWADLIGSDTKIGNSVPAIAIGFIMLLLPANLRNFGGRRILDWKTVHAKMPWGIFILIGGAFAIADAAQKSGLSHFIGSKLSALSVLSPGSIVAVICFMTAMLTEIISNSSTVTILLPVFNQVAISIGVNPLFLMLPVTIVCSYAFMLPIATAPNAIVFESGNMRTLDMVKPGLVMNIICCAIQLFMINTLGVAMFDLNTFPHWANKTTILPSSIVTESPNETTAFVSGMFFENITSSFEVINNNI